MALPAFYSADLPEAGSLWLEAATARHVLQVLRMKTGDLIQLTNGKGVVVTTRIAEAGKKGCVVELGERTVVPPPERQTTVAVSLLRNASRFEWFLEKATELGLRRIIPLLCRRTEKQHFRTERMQSILISALLQSQQSWLPQLDEPMPFSEFVEIPAGHPAGIGYCGEAGKQELKDFPGLRAHSCTLAIGPEGDFTEEEMSLAISKGFVPLSFGEQRLRTETAAMVAAVMVQMGGR